MIVLSGSVWAQPTGSGVEAKARTALDERVDIPVELQNPIDLRRATSGDAIKLKITHDIVAGGKTVIPKGAIVAGKITWLQWHLGQPLSMALLAERATWKDQTFDLRGYIWGPIRSIAHEISTASQPKIGHTRADSNLGSVLDVLWFELAPPYCANVLHCEALVFESGSSFVVRHLPPEYKLDLLYNDAAYGRARALQSDARAANAPAEFELGEGFRTGELFVKDDTQAFHWYSEAAEQGHLAAQTNVAVFFAQGVGVPKDYVMAYKWFSVSSQRGMSQNDTALQKLEQVLTAEQIQEGKRLANSWLQTHPKQP